MNFNIFYYIIENIKKENQLLGLIEYQGDIHFTYKKTGWNTESSFKERQKRDKLKKRIL